ncbi:MAG: hypothetical protein PHH37_07500 [Paludibacter sp.]|nr:hypothetical protein [Paludibacter sp.]
MNKVFILKTTLLSLLILCISNSYCQKFPTYTPSLSYEAVDKKTDKILQQMTLDEKIEFIAGDDMLVRGIKRFNIPSVITADATEGVHLAWDDSGNIKWNVKLKKVQFFNDLPVCYLFLISIEKSFLDALNILPKKPFLIIFALRLK